MVLPHEIYIDQLAFSLGGCPLWGSLHPQLDPVDILDVGYLSDRGGWIKLFNLRTETDPNKLPSNHRPASVVITDEDIEKDVFKGPRWSNSIRKLGGNIGVQGKAEGCLSFECAEEKGAILFVAEDAVARNALNTDQFIKLIKENIESWMEFAKRKGRGIKMSDLVLVTGYVRTTTWVAAVFGQKSQWCKFSVGGVFPAGGAKLELWGSIDVNASAWTGGPENRMKTGSPLDTTHFLKHMASDVSPPALLCKDDPRHQCVLIRGYRMAGRHWQQLLPFKKKKTLKGIEVLKQNSRKSPTNSTTRIVGASELVINTDNEIAIDTDIGMVIDTDVTVANDADTQIPEPMSIDTVYTIYENESLEGSLPNDNEIKVIPSESSVKGSSSNRRGRRTRRRGNLPNPGGGHGGRRHDGGAGAGSSSGGSSGNSCVGYQSSSGSASNSGGQSSGSRNTGQQKGKSGNVTDAIELDQNKSEHLSESVCVSDNFEDIESESEVVSEFESEPSESECSGDSMEVASSPWDVFLEYLLQTEEKARYAIVHDDDFSIVKMMEVKSASELRAQLQASRPRVYLNGGVGMLKPTALEFFRSTGYFCQTDTEGPMAYFPKDLPSYDQLVGINRIHTFSDYQESPEILFATLKKVYIHAQTYIYSIQCEYQGPEGKILLGNKHGNSGEAPLYVFELNSDEYIIKIRGRSGEYIDQLQFLTNKGRVSSTYGGSGGKPFVWIVDEQRYPNSPGLHHFEGTFDNYIRTLKASFPIYPWFEDGTQNTVPTGSESGVGTDSDLPTAVELSNHTQLSLDNVCEIVIFSEKTTKNVQHIRVDAVSKILQDTKGQAYIRRRFRKLLEMLRKSDPSTIHCASVVVAGLARLGGFESEIKKMLMSSIRHLLEDNERYILLQKLAKQDVFKKAIISHLSVLIEMLKYGNVSVQWNTSALLGHLSAQPTIQTSFEGVFDTTSALLNRKDDSARCISIELLINLAEQAQFQLHIIKVLPTIISFLRNHNFYVQTSAANAIGKLVERENFRPYLKEYTTVIVWRLTGLMKDNHLSVQLSGKNALIKLSQQDEFRNAIVENLPNFVSLVDSEYAYVPMNGIALLGELAECAAFTTEISNVLRPDNPTPLKSYNPSAWVNVLAVSSAMLDQLRHDEKLDFYLSQLIGMLEDVNENVRNNSSDVIEKLLKYVKDPLVVDRLLNVTTSSNICKLNGVNALLTICEEVTYGNTISSVISQTIPDLVEMLRTDNRKRVVSVLLKVAKQAGLRQEIIGAIPEIVKLLQQSTHSLGIRPAGVELLTGFAEFAEFRPTIVNDLSYLLTLLNDREASVELTSLSLLEVLSTDETSVTLMVPLVIPLIKKLFLREDPDMDRKGMTILLNISKRGEHKATVVAMIKEVALDIANSIARAEPFFSYFSPAEHISEPKSSFVRGAQPLSTGYMNGAELLRLLSEQVEFQNPILEAVPIFVEAAKEPRDGIVYDILKMLSVHGELQSAVKSVIPSVIEKIENNGRYLQACLDLLWTLSEQAVYWPAIMPFASRLASLMNANDFIPDVRITMAGILMNLRMVISNPSRSGTTLVSNQSMADLKKPSMMFSKKGEVGGETKLSETSEIVHHYKKINDEDRERRGSGIQLLRRIHAERHKQSKIEIKGKIFTCSYCDQTFRRKDTLNEHERVVHMTDYLRSKSYLDFRRSSV